jgi:hypothetical protein
MKHIIASFLLLFVSGISDAQYVSNLKLNYDGNFTTPDGKDYDVAEFEGKDATDLFEMVNKHVALVYRSPKDVESNINDKIISIYGYARNCTIISWGIKMYLSFHYSLKFQFKDGKIRIEVPVLFDMEGFCYGGYTFHEALMAADIFNKKGVLSEKPKKRKTVIMLEDYFNDLINRVINGDEKAKGEW